MKRAISVLIAAAVAAAIWWWSGSGNATPESSRARTGETPAVNGLESLPARPLIRQDASGKPKSGPPGQDTSPDVRVQFWASNDYWEFAERIHEAAKQGDGASQYYLGLALNTCDFLYRYYFMDQGPGARTRIRTLDEAQQLTTTRQGSAYSPEDVRDIQNRCQRIMSTTPPPFGNASEWMTAAEQSGYPLARVNAATSKALQGRNDPLPEKARDARNEARALVIDALRSKDAEVMLALASPMAFLAGDEPGEALKSHWTWVMAAYLREPNGASLAEWKKQHCALASQCHPDDTLLDVIRRAAGNDLDEIERRARELNEKIDAGTVDESDI